MKPTASDFLVKKCIVSSCIIIKDGKTLLLMHKKLNVWIYPGGHIDENEVPTQSAIREAREETGYKVSLIGKKPLGQDEKGVAIEEPLPICVLYETVPYKTGTHMHFDNVYLAVPMGKPKKISKDESPQLRWFSEKEIDKLKTYKNIKAVLHLAFKSFKLRVVEQY